MFDFLRGKRKTPLDKIETVIGSNTSFEGHLKCDGHIRIDGICENGVIETVGNVVVAPGAQVAATIIAEHVSVAGEVTGAIRARGYLEILSTGRVSGDVQVANFYKDEEGILSGKLTMGDPSGEDTDHDDSLMDQMAYDNEGVAQEANFAGHDSGVGTDASSETMAKAEVQAEDISPDEKSKRRARSRSAR